MPVLDQIKELFLQALPTFFLVLILYFFIKSVFIGPLEATLRKRREATDGLREAADAAIARAEAKANEYHKALLSAKSDIYHVQEQERQKGLDQRASLLGQAQQRAAEMVGRAKQEIQSDAEDAKKTLASDAEQIAASITNAILKPAADRR
jgi:F-type H+-transporting ATPase subunit b